MIFPVRLFWLLMAFVVCSVGISAYNLSAPFVWLDDSLLLREQPLSWAQLRHLFSHGFELNEAAYWRPLTSLSFLITNHLPDSAQAARLFNLALYIVSLGVLFGASKFLFDFRNHDPKYRTIAFYLSFILLAFHAFWVEPIQWIAGRFDLLAGLFFFLAFFFLFHPHIKQKNHRLLGASLSLVFALLSKDALIVAIPGFLFFIALSHPKASLSKLATFKTAAILLCPVLVWAVIWQGVLQSSSGTADFSLALPLAQKIDIFTQSFYLYVQRAFIPLVTSEPFWVVNPLGWWPSIMGGALFLLMPVACIYLSKNHRLLAITIATVWIHFSLLCCLNTYHRYSLEAIGADRYALVDLPFIGLIYFLSFEHLFKRLSCLWVCSISAVSILLSIVTFIMATLSWANEQAFWNDTLKVSPLSATAALHVAKELKVRQQPELALKSMIESSSWIEEAIHPDSSVRLSWNARLIALKADLLYQHEGPSTSLPYLDQWINERQLGVPPILAETAKQLYLTGSCENATIIKKVFVSTSLGVQKESLVSAVELDKLALKCKASD